MSETHSSRTRTRTCPICGNEVDRGGKHFPFCSERCRVIDLGKLAKGEYRITRPIERKDLEKREPLSQRRTRRV